MLVRILSSFVVISGCGGSPATNEAPTSAASPSSTATAAPVAAAPTGAGVHGLAESPLTPMANAMVDVVFAAAREEAPPTDGPIPIIPSDEPSPCEDPGEIPNVVAFCDDPDSFHVRAVQIDFGFHVREPDESAPNVVFTNVIVGPERAGIGLAMAVSEPTPRFETLPDWLGTSAPEAARWIRAALSGEDPSDILVPLADLPPDYARELGEIRAEGSRMAAAIELARLDTEIRAYTRDDLYVFLKSDDEAWVAARVHYADRDETGLATRVRLREL